MWEKWREFQDSMQKSTEIETQETNKNMAMKQKRPIFSNKKTYEVQLTSLKRWAERRERPLKLIPSPSDAADTLTLSKCLLGCVRRL